MSRSRKDIFKESILKTASIKSTFMGATMGAGLGAIKATNDNDKVPGKSVEDKAIGVGGKSLGGAILGGTTSAIAGGLANKTGKALGFLKKSEIEVPEKEEHSKSEEIDARKEVLESPNPDEVKRINNSLCSRKQEMKDRIEKAAELYMKETICENCGFEGRMNSADGRCPQCESMSGVRLKEAPIKDTSTNMQTREERRGRIYDEINNARRDVMSYY